MFTVFQSQQNPFFNHICVYSTRSAANIESMWDHMSVYFSDYGNSDKPQGFFLCRRRKPKLLSSLPLLHEKKKKKKPRLRLFMQLAAAKSNTQLMGGGRGSERRNSSGFPSRGRSFTNRKQREQNQGGKYTIPKRMECQITVGLLVCLWVSWCSYPPLVFPVLLRWVRGSLEANLSSSFHSRSHSSSVYTSPDCTKTHSTYLNRGTLSATQSQLTTHKSEPQIEQLKT